MVNKKYILLVNRICDEFESSLKTGTSSDIEQMLVAAKLENHEPEFLDSLLPELIALKIAYSDDRQATAKTLRLKYPNRSHAIEFAIEQPSLLGTVGASEDDTAFDNSLPKSKVKELIPELSSRFDNLNHLASGGLGDVYVGYDKSVQRRVAIKLLKPSLVANPEAKGRFLNEGAITGGLEHPSIVPIYDSGVTEDGQPYYAMRLLEGLSLKAAIDELHAEPESSDFEQRQRALLRRLIDVCDAISYAHNKGVIHRDLKPANILLGEYGESVVVDWGLARQHDDSVGKFESASVDLKPSKNPITQIGHVVGTPEYMSPEQASGDPTVVGKHSDVYSLGAILYCILTGSPPHGRAADMTLARIEQAQQRVFQSAAARNTSVPKALDAICAKAMSLKPTDRYCSPQELALDLDSWLSDQPVIALPDSLFQKSARFLRKHRRWSAAAAVSLIAVAIGSTIAATVINGQARELTERKTEAEKQAQVQTELAKKEAKSARLAEEAGANNTSYVNFMSDFFKNLSPDEEGVDMKMTDALKQLLTTVRDQTHLSDETKRDVLASVFSGFYAVGNTEQALAAAKECEELSCQLYGPNSHTSAEAKGALVAALVLDGKGKDALHLADKTLAIIRSNDFPAKSIEKVQNLESDIMFHRIRALRSLERHEDAVRGFEELFPWLKDLDLDSLPTSEHQLNFASQYIEELRRVGKTDQALQWQKKLYAAQKRIAGPSKTGTLGNLYRLTQAVAAEEGHKAALPYRKELVDKASEILGNEHSNTLVAKTSLADSYFFLGQYEESRARLSALRETFLRLNNNQASRFGVETKLARTRLFLDKNESALDLMESVVEGIEADENIDPLSPVATVGKYFLSIAQIENGEFNEALQAIRSEIKEFEDAGRQKDSVNPEIRGRLQLAYLLLGEFESALAQREYFTDEISHETIVENSQTAEVLFELGKVDQAKEITVRILELPPKKDENPYATERSRCMQANMKGLLSATIKESDPERSRKLLVEAVTELNDRFKVMMPNTWIERPLNYHGRKLIEFYESTNDTQSAQFWRKHLGD